MPPPLSAYVDAAKRFGNIKSEDIAVVEDFYVRVFPGMPKSKKEKILAHILAHEGRPAPASPPARASALPHQAAGGPSGVLTIKSLPSFFGAAMAKSFAPVARLPKRMTP